MGVLAINEQIHFRNKLTLWFEIDYGLLGLLLEMLTGSAIQEDLRIFGENSKYFTNAYLCAAKARKFYYTEKVQLIKCNWMQQNEMILAAS